MHALPALLFRAEALMRLGGFKAPLYGSGARTEGPICPEPLAHNSAKLNGHALQALFNGVIRALARGRVFAAPVTSIVDATDLETTAQ
jgi:hypothetical protein